ncbi:fumarylacetoacetate hydrolase family protein [Nocardioides ganghwensis]|uniref:FAA hydrolase family protein n=1 Tax=Nocardioides ganghwensis TaxID=252230 RepID=A0A4Q2SLW7_9ACTN|nr:fumarylacetoacetate hydrolase family protein [Nocardioides ganghwensis]MBD3944866.1 fumarylacetoacetate hydrolase family protein [Nocardioides ganghwensis]RYC05120.1 FAA hydrolase family protein [Nocardioides ganghwensis]
MRLATILDHGTDVPVLVDPDRGVVPISALGDRQVPSLLTVLEEGLYDDLVAAAAEADAGHFRPTADVTFTAPYRRPRKIWGIGLNYVDHAADLSESVPEEPASFIKGDHTIIGTADEIPIPPQSERTTAEGELALVIGRECRNVSEEDALDHVFGVTTVLDQTAEDILQRNPRFLTRSKNFPGFFSFGPEIVPMAEVLERFGAIGAVEVSTVVNGDQTRTNTVEHMRYSPAFLVAFHSAVMPLFPGDVISTGTPGAIHVRAGDVAECRIPGIGRLVNPVVDA